ncbi:hypothetical protein ASPWEDRAFT_166206 [Aspergillus wentii DTO 134E9]|uniref:Peptidase S1 domain-containing protein n=1 Tax=Aspergillus wentii DTO 134E9 TaxID=1073089 RepID=A0A1L9RYW0_ASPWE|nr:uncharacterized protein ASPWEDRAFT_166206 [Aspergillus wentii DTO 134E9]KAI9932554.1 hypothetical protein MW887_008796 [Aspergillus wentii]OJJ40119.1 hypothetical protein ASPWEDRAFT_166206 [Aspergillus wentii DTO 134E9]
MKIHLSTILFTLRLVLAAEEIVGGSQARIEDYPYQVSLHNNDTFLCGGSIISTEHILTAAHCVTPYLGRPLSVRVGSSEYESGGELIDVAKATPHLEFDTSTLQNDIAILRLAKNLEFGPKVLPVELPCSCDGDPATGTKCSVSGWGATTADGDVVPHLRAAFVPITDHKECAENLAASGHDHVTDLMICAGEVAGGRDSCSGDSGGPLVDVSSKKQVGVVSWGFGCGRPGFEGVYTSTAAYEAWILENSLL